MSDYINRLKKLAQNPKLVFALPQVKKLIEYAANLEDGQSQWISVEDELPESAFYIVIGYIKKGPCVENSSISLNMNDAMWKYVTHWQPPPEPPKGE